MDLSTTNKLMYISGFLLLIFFVINISQYKKSTGENKAPLTFFLYLTAYVFILPISIALLLIFAIYRQFVSLILKIKYGSKFGGLLEDADAVYAAEKPSKNVINVLMICEYDEKRYMQSSYETAKQSVYNFYFRNPERFPKFLSTYHKFMGYSYMVKNNVNIEDCVKKFRNNDGKKLDREGVMQMVTDYSNSSLPKNDTVLWEVLVGTQPVVWNEKIQAKTYPVMFRVHHSVADGVSLIKLMVGAFADDPTIKIVSPEVWKTNQIDEKTVSKEQVLSFYKQSRKLMEFLLLSLYVLCLAPATFFIQTFLKANDRNSLHGSALSGQMQLALNAEVSKKYVQKIKKIKDRIPGTAFPEIILTAFSASLDEYFAKISSDYPKHVTAMIPVLSGSSELKQLTPGKKVDLSLKNKFSLLFLNLPLRVQSGETTPVIERLKSLQKQTSCMKKSIDYMVNYWILSVALGHLPYTLIKLFLVVTRCTAAISVLPGPPNLTFCGGSSVHDIAFWVPHVGYTGACFSALTYDGRLQIGFNVDKALISDRKEAQSIVDGVYKYLDLLDNETA